MQRRKFMQQSLLAGGSLIAAGNVFSAQQKKDLLDNNEPFHLPYAMHDGMFKNHGGADIVDQIKFAHSVGFRAIEDNGMMSRTPEQTETYRRYPGTTGLAHGRFCDRV